MPPLSQGQLSPNSGSVTASVPASTTGKCPLGLETCRSEYMKDPPPTPGSPHVSGTPSLSWYKPAPGLIDIPEVKAPRVGKPKANSVHRNCTGSAPHFLLGGCVDRGHVPPPPLPLSPELTALAALVLGEGELSQVLSQQVLPAALISSYGYWGHPLTPQINSPKVSHPTFSPVELKVSCPRLPKFMKQP